LESFVPEFEQFLLLSRQFTTDLLIYAKSGLEKY